MPRCYLLTVAAGSALDQHSNNVSLFNVVEQINVPAGAQPPPRGIIPLELHAYWQLASREINQPFDMRFVMLADSGLETPSEIYTHKPATPRFRTRTLGLPAPPVVGHYELRVDWRESGTEGWSRESAAWPIAIVELRPQSAMVH
jgi:hypothetical protein